MGKIDDIMDALQKSVNFVNHNVLRILPFSALFFISAMMYSVAWYVLDFFKDVACLNGNYVIELLFCTLYLGLLGKHIIAMVISSATIVPFAALVYLTHRINTGEKKSLVTSIKNSIPGIIKIVTFRVLLTLALFAPFILYILFGGDIITSMITDTGRLTIQKLITINLLPIPVTLFFGFVMIALLEPVFQYVEYEVLINNSRLRRAVRSSYKLAMKYKLETFLSGFFFVFLWDVLIIMKFMYMIHILLVIALMAAVFLESFLVFPVRAIFLYFLWDDLKRDFKRGTQQPNSLKSYTNRMLLG